MSMNFNNCRYMHGLYKETPSGSPAQGSIRALLLPNMSLVKTDHYKYTGINLSSNLSGLSTLNSFVAKPGN